MVESTPLRLLKDRLPARQDQWHGAGRQAAVLVALSDEPEPVVLLGRRASHLSLHPGEIAFPGGKREPEDAAPWHTACREAEEEVALPALVARPLGQLSPLITRSNFEVHPCIAVISPGLILQAAPEEFDELLHFPLQNFSRHQHFRLEVMRRNGVQKKVPFYQLGGCTIWGVTAAVLAQLANLAYDAGIDLQRDWTTNR